MGEEVEIQRGMEGDVRRGGQMRRNLITLLCDRVQPSFRWQQMKKKVTVE